MLLPTLFNNHNRVNEFPTLFDDLFLLDFPKASPKNYMLPMDMEETEDSYKITLDVPGLNKENIDISVDNNILTVSLSKQEDIKDRKYLLRERKSIKANRSVSLPKNVNADSINASLINGVLNIDLMKEVNGTSKKIEIT